LRQPELRSQNLAEQRARTPGAGDLPRGLAARRAGEERCLLALRRAQPGIILPLSYKTAYFQG
jgi:hypothetical protein